MARPQITWNCARWRGRNPEKLGHSRTFRRPPRRTRGPAVLQASPENHDPRPRAIGSGELRRRGLPLNCTASVRPPSNPVVPSIRRSEGGVFALDPLSVSASTPKRERLPRRPRGRQMTSHSPIYKHLWVAKTPWRGKVTTSIWAQYTSRVGFLDLGRVHWRQTEVCLTRTNDRSRTRCSDHGHADWEGRFF
jgi:hypothetical protein